MASPYNLQRGPVPPNDGSGLPGHYGMGSVAPAQMANAAMGARAYPQPGLQPMVPPPVGAFGPPMQPSPGAAQLSQSVQAARQMPYAPQGAPQAPQGYLPGYPAQGGQQLAQSVQRARQNYQPQMMPR